MKSPVSPLLLLLILVSCTTTDDPRKGGLIGYLGTGESGYQRRIDQKEDERGLAEDRAQREHRKEGALSTQRETVRERLEAQRQEMAAIQAETARLREAVVELEGLDAAKSAERERIIQELNHIDQLVGELEGNSTLLLEQKQARIAELKAEVNLLVEQSSC